MGEAEIYEAMKTMFSSQKGSKSRHVPTMGQSMEQIMKEVAANYTVKPTDPSKDPKAYVTSLGYDPYNWEDRDVREAPMWMLYEAERQETLVPQREVKPTVPTMDSATKLTMPMRDANGFAYGYGGRKRAHAQVWVREGDGTIRVNGKSIVEYFPRMYDRRIMLEPLMVSMMIGALDVHVLVNGGGPSGQAGAARHGIATALSRFDPAFKPLLRKFKLLLRDPRSVERKKVGQKKARKKFQWVKR